MKIVGTSKELDLVVNALTDEERTPFCTKIINYARFACRLASCAHAHVEEQSLNAAV